MSRNTLSFIQEIPPEYLRGAGIPRRNAILNGTISDILAVQGEFTLAEHHGTENVRVSKALVQSFRGSEADPDYGDRQRGLAIAYERMGFIKWCQGRYDEAINSYELAEKINDALRPDQNNNYRKTKAYTYLGLGDAHRDFGSAEIARRYYGLFKEISDDLAPRAPKDTNLARNNITALHRLADLEIRFGNAKEARILLQACLSKPAIPDLWFPRNSVPSDPQGECKRMLVELDRND